MKARTAVRNYTAISANYGSRKTISSAVVSSVTVDFRRIGFAAPPNFILKIPKLQHFPERRNFDAKQGLTLGNFMEATMNGLIYIVGLVVVILAVLSFFGLR